MIDINLPILGAQIVTFLLAVAVLWKIAWGPLCTVLKERSQNIKDSIRAAEEAKKSVAKLEEEYKARLRLIQEEASRLVEEGRTSGAKEKEEIMRSAAREAEALMEKARLQLQADKERLLQELRAEVSGLSVEIARKLLKEHMSKDLQDQFFSESLREIESIDKKS